MAQKYYMPYNDEERASWLNNFASKLPQYASKYGIAPEEMMDIQNSAQYFTAVLNYRTQLQAFQAAVTDHKNALVKGLKAGAVLQLLTPPNFMLSMPVEAGIFIRATALVNRMKAHLRYTEADGSDLGIIGTERSVTDTNTIKPDISARIAGGGRPEIVWGRQGMTALEIQKRIGDEPWRLLALDTLPNYTDMEPLPSAGQSVVWQYRAMYHFKDERVGVWSDVVAITVTG